MSNAGLGLFTAAIAAALYRIFTQPKPKPKAERKVYGTYLPPLPNAVVAVLKATRLCFLATNDNQEPHLSLMNFTYVREGEIIVLATRRDTKKFGQLTSNPKVAILVHDFPHVRFEGEGTDSFHGKTWSITLNGIARVCEEGCAEEEKLRKLHLENNLDYKQFIIGNKEIAIIAVELEKARICDIKDQVSYWNYVHGLSTTDTVLAY